MRRAGYHRTTFIKMGLVALILILLTVVGFLLLNQLEYILGKYPEHEVQEQTVVYDGNEYVLKKNVETFLVIGLDKSSIDLSEESYNNDKQADFLMLFIFDNDAKECKAVHINRDTIVDVNVLGVAGNAIDTVKKQIALAHTYGNGKDVSCHNTADSVSSLLNGTKINHYMSITLDAVPVFNDLLGGVELEIMDDFSSIDETLIKGKTMTLTGEQALTYVRSRAGLEDNSNSARMQRQQQYIKALQKKFYACVDQDSEFLVDASMKMADYIISDRSVTQLQSLADKFYEYEFLGIDDFDGESVVGEQFIEFYPDEDAIQEFVINTFYRLKY